MSKKKQSLKSVKNIFYMTSILDSLPEGQIQKLQESIDGTRSVFLITCNNNNSRYILKTFTCNSESKSDIDNARDEFARTKRLAKLSKHIAEPLKIDEIGNNELKEAYIEILYDYEGENLLSLIGKLDSMQIIDIALKTLEPLSIMAANNVFHGDIKPGNIVIKDGILKIIDFGSAKDLEKRSQLFGTLNGITGKMSEHSPIYSPPEIHRMTPPYVIHSIDVYCWGMTIYQLATGDTESMLAEYVNSYKIKDKDYKKFIDIVQGIKLKNDPDLKISQKLIEILTKTLDLNPKNRPTFAELKSDFEKSFIDPNSRLHNLQIEFSALKNEFEGYKLLKEAELTKAKNEAEIYKKKYEMLSYEFSEYKKNAAKIKEELISYKSKSELLHKDSDVKPKTEITTPNDKIAEILTKYNKLDDLIYFMKLAEKTEKYNEMTHFAKKAIEMGYDFNTKELRGLFSAAYRNRIELLKSSWKAYDLDENKDKSRENSVLENIKNAKNMIWNEIKQLIDEVANLYKSYLLPKANIPETKVFYLMIIADFYKIASECTIGDEQKTLITKTDKIYKKTSEIAENLPATDPCRLFLALKYSVHLFEIMKSPSEACKIAKAAFDSAIDNLKNLEDEEFKFSFSILKLLNENFIHWQNDSKK